MLDDDEFQRVTSLRGTGRGDDLKEREFGPVLQEYQRVTGFYETNLNAVYNHRLSLYGPPCRNCRKPLRTPQAKLCAASMTPLK